MPVILAMRPGIPDYRFRAVLNGDEYAFRARWNSRLKLWALDAADRANTPIFSGALIVLGAYIGRTASHKLVQEGFLLARDSTKSGREAGFDDIGTRVQVFYFTIDEMRAELIASAIGPA